MGFSAGSQSYCAVSSVLQVEESENEWSVPHCFTIYSAQRTVVVAAR